MGCVMRSIKSLETLLDGGAGVVLPGKCLFNVAILR